MMQLLLAYLPVDIAAWPALLGKKRKAYAEFCEVRRFVQTSYSIDSSTVSHRAQ